MVISQQQGSSNREGDHRKEELFQDADAIMVDEIRDMNLEELLSYQKSLSLTIDQLEEDLAKLKSTQLPMLIKDHWNDLNSLIEELEGYLGDPGTYSSSRSSLGEG
jgi:hypothetical protein